MKTCYKCKSENIATVSSDAISVSLSCAYKCMDCGHMFVEYDKTKEINSDAAKNEKRAEFLVEYEKLVWKYGAIVSGYAPNFPFIDQPLFSGRYLHLDSLKEQLAKENECQP